MSCHVNKTSSSSSSAAMPWRNHILNDGDPGGPLSSPFACFAYFSTYVPLYIFSYSAFELQVCLINSVVSCQLSPLPITFCPLFLPFFSLVLFYIPPFPLFHFPSYSPVQLEDTVRLSSLYQGRRTLIGGYIRRWLDASRGVIGIFVTSFSSNCEKKLGAVRVLRAADL